MATKVSSIGAQSSGAGRAKGHGEFLRVWESSAPLTAEQNALCEKLEAAVASERAPSTAPPKPDAYDSPAVIASASVSLPGGAARVYEGADGLAGLNGVATAEEFHAWHAEMEHRLEEAQDGRFRSMLAALTADRDACVRLLGMVADASSALKHVVASAKAVADTTAAFREQCETLVAERKRMSELADALRCRLTYFEELETLTVKFGNGPDAISPTHPDFVKLLHRLDECVTYASSSTGAVAEADGYVARFLDVQRRAFTIVRNHTIALICSTAAQVAKELKDERAAGAGFRHADLTDASKEYLRFRTIASRVKGLMTELHERAKAPNALMSINGASGAAGSSPYSRTRAVGDALSASNNNSIGSGTLAGNPAFSTRSAAMALYNDCEECFVEQRRLLLEPSVTAHIKSLAEVRNMIALARLGSTYILRVCQLERQLYEHFFPVPLSSSTTAGDRDVSLSSNPKGGLFSNDIDADLSIEDSPVLAVALNSVCDVLYTELRPQILKETELDKLVYLIEVLKTEILGDEVPRRGAAGIAFAPSAVRAIADAQERIIYRSELFLRDEIRGFIPEPEHLDYPERILQRSKTRSFAFAPAQSNSVPVGSVSAAQAADSDALSTSAPAPATISSASTLTLQDIQSEGIYSSWYPPVERTLRLLSMLYRCVDGQVFAGLAQEAVSLCVQSVMLASSKIAASGKPDAEDHAQLFLVWQLLMTREQISPFDVDMSYTEHELDFVELRSLLGSVIRGQLPVRSLATPPAVREKISNSKQELDLRVRSACEIFILKTTRTLLEPVLKFLATSNAMPSSTSTSTAGKGGKGAPIAGEAPPTSPPVNAFDALKANKGSFSHPARLRAMWDVVEEAVEKALPQIVARMKIYITKAASRAVLLRPVRANVAEASTELLSALQMRYTLEERAETRIDGMRVQKLLDAFDVITDLVQNAPRSTRSTSSKQG
jgi:conserved oligomeric Golgi complex subunit 3